jgi:hypothetical protein
MGGGCTARDQTEDARRDDAMGAHAAAHRMHRRAGPSSTEVGLSSPWQSSTADRSESVTTRLVWVMHWSSLLTTNPLLATMSTLCATPRPSGNLLDWTCKPVSIQRTSYNYSSNRHAFGQTNTTPNPCQCCVVYPTTNSKSYRLCA